MADPFLADIEIRPVHPVFCEAQERQCDLMIWIDGWGARCLAYRVRLPIHPDGSAQHARCDQCLEAERRARG